MVDDVTKAAAAAEQGVRALGGLPEHVALALIAVVGLVLLTLIWTRRIKSEVSGETLRLVTLSIHEQSQSVLTLSGTVGEISATMLQLSSDMQALAAQNARIIEQNHELLERMSQRECMAR